MKLKIALIVSIASATSVAFGALSHVPQVALYQRTDGLNVGAPNDEFTGAIPDRFDPAATQSPFVDVDSEPGNAPVNLIGDNFDLAFTFEFYDSDGNFSFTENFDDRVQVNISQITSATNLTVIGAPGPTHSDGGWNVRTYADYNFGGGGWFAAEVLFTEDGGGAQSAGGIGFGFSPNASSGVDTDFGGIGYVHANGQAAFDVDPGSGLSWGSAVIPEPSSTLSLALGCALVFLRRRRS